MNPRLPLELDLKILTAALLALMMFPAFAGLKVGVSDTCNGDSAGVFYLEALKTAGHEANVITNSVNTNALREVIKSFDLVLFTGGEDVDPARYGESPSPKLGEVNLARDEFDFALFAACVAEHKPILGICRGMQAMNVFFGGTLYQDIGSEYRPPAGATADRHDGMDFLAGATNPPSHELFVVPSSRLGHIIGNVPMKVNSHHHQGVKKLAPGFRVAARSGDGFVEAIECDTYPAAGVQFHPEQTLHFKPKSGFELDRHLDFFKRIDRFAGRADRLDPYSNPGRADRLDPPRLLETSSPTSQAVPEGVSLSGRADRPDPPRLLETSSPTSQAVPEGAILK